MSADQFGAQKNSRFPGPNPLPLVQVMDMHASKIIKLKASLLPPITKLIRDQEETCKVH
jgi:hypothetical protein